MKNTLKQIVATLIIVTTISVAQEKSDYEITQEFQTKYKALTTQMDEASSVEQCTEIGNGIDELEKNYSSYKKMLDKALYPDDFTKKITDIRNQLKLTQERVAIIGTQGARIAELESQVDKLSGENSEMLLRIASLEDQAKADMGSEWEKLDLIKLHIREDKEMLTDIALSTMMKGETVKVKDKSNNDYDPVFSVRFQKSREVKQQK